MAPHDDPTPLVTLAEFRAMQQPLIAMAHALARYLTTCAENLACRPAEVNMQRSCDVTNTYVTLLEHLSLWLPELTPDAEPLPVVLPQAVEGIESLVAEWYAKVEARLRDPKARAFCVVADVLFDGEYLATALLCGGEVQRVQAPQARYVFVWAYPGTTTSRELIQVAVRRLTRLRIVRWTECPPSVRTVPDEAFFRLGMARDTVMALVRQGCDIALLDEFAPPGWVPADDQGGVALQIDASSAEGEE